MNTMDEVIKALEYCLNPVDNFGNCNAECPYIHCCDPSNHDVTEDALHYLKKYREEYKTLIKTINEAIDMEMKYYDMIEELERNSPLTWDELHTMKGKPIWVEYSGYTPHWEIVENTGVVRVETNMSILHKEDQGTTWQAYRKERNEII